MTDTQPFQAEIPIKGWRNSKGIPCALVEYQDGPYAEGAGWSSRGYYRRQALYAPPTEAQAAIKAGERPETIPGVAQVPSDERVLWVLARMAKGLGHHRYSQELGDDPDRTMITGGVSFQGAKGGVYVVDQSGRYRKFYADGAAAASTETEN
jgi:hypothetical protein